MKYTAYHGTKEKFENFDNNACGKNYNDNASACGFFFSEDFDDAEFFGPIVIECEIELNRPLIINDAKMDEYLQKWLSDLEVNDPEQYEFQMSTKAYANSGEVNVALELAIVDANRSGNDGVIIETVGDPKWYVVFSANKIEILD